MADMLERHDTVRVPVESTLSKLHQKERDKRKKEKMLKLFLSYEEVVLLSDLVNALQIVKKASERLCMNVVTLSSADRVRLWQNVTELHLSNINFVSDL